MNNVCAHVSHNPGKKKSEAYCFQSYSKVKTPLEFAQKARNNFSIKCVRDEHGDDKLFRYDGPALARSENFSTHIFF